MTGYTRTATTSEHYQADSGEYQAGHITFSGYYGEGGSGLSGFCTIILDRRLIRFITVALRFSENNSILELQQGKLTISKELGDKRKRSPNPNILTRQNYTLPHHKSL